MTNDFKSMENIAHVAEKWSCLSRDKINFYLLPEEEVHHRRVQSKRFTSKEVLLFALAKSRKMTFDGKLGLL